MRWIIIKNGWAQLNNKKWRRINPNLNKDARLKTYQHLIILLSN